ncbi:MAG: hypothetical protein V1916_03580 [Patescibacteria group bacterium]
MKRSKKIIFACHCLLNQNARARGVAKRSGVVKEFVDYCTARGYGIVPIDCPQLQFEPLRRPPATREHYDTRRVRTVCRTVADATLRQARMYRRAGYRVYGIFGVEGSPTCGAIRTHVTSPDGRSTNVNGSGIFFDELKTVMKKFHQSIPVFDWDIQAKKPIGR